MINFVLILMVSFFSNIQSVFTRMFNKKLDATVENTAIFAVVRVAVIAAFFLVLSGFRLCWHWPTVPYALVFGITLTGTMIASAMAIMIGPFALTNLLLSSSVALVTLTGIFFLGESVDPPMLAGMILLGAAMLLLYEKEPDMDSKITPRWWLYLILAFCSSACGTIVSKLHQTAFPGQYTNEFMLMGCIPCGVLCIIYCLCKKVTLVQAKEACQKAWFPMVGVGVGIAAANILLLYLNARAAASLVYPTLSALGIVVSAVLGKFVYHETSTVRQKWSFIIGACSVLLMNL